MIVESVCGDHHVVSDLGSMDFVSWCSEEPAPPTENTPWLSKDPCQGRSGCVQKRLGMLRCVAEAGAYECEEHCCFSRDTEAWPAVLWSNRAISDRRPPHLARPGHSRPLESAPVLGRVHPCDKQPHGAVDSAQPQNTTAV
jgi:hypothetical protein